MADTIPHTCTPGSFCGLCLHNVRSGGQANHPSNLTRPKVTRSDAARTPLTVARGHCLHLGRRVEFRPGCGGRMCRHECLKGHPEAVPGGSCQTCPDHEADAGSP